MAVVANRFPMLKVLRVRAFALLWAGQAISLLGDSMFRFALTWQVFMLSHSSTALAIVQLANLLPFVIFGLFGGAIADKFPRRLVMIVSDIGRGLAVILIAGLTWFHMLQLWHLITLALVFGLADSFFQPSYQSFLPQLLDETSYQPANALVGLGTTITGVIGPLLSSLSISVGGSASVFALDGFSFLLSVVSLLLISYVSDTHNKGQLEQKGEDQEVAEALMPKAPNGANVFHDILDGVRYVKSLSWLWISISVAAVGNVLYFGSITIMLPKLLYGSYGVKPGLYGIVLASNAMGDIVAALLIGHLKIKRRGVIAYLALGLCGLGLIALGLPMKLVPLAWIPLLPIAAMACAGFGLGVFMLLWMTILQEYIPSEKMGRVMSVDQVGSSVLLPLGVPLIGVLADHVPPTVVFLTVGLLWLIIVAGVLCIRNIRNLA